MNKNRIIFFLILFSINSYGTAWSYGDKITHPQLTKEAVIRSELDVFLIDNLGIEDGIRRNFTNVDIAQFNPDDARQTVLRWLGHGAEFEDLGSRATNHFYNPLDNSGLNDLLNGEPNKAWALGFTDEGVALDNCTGSLADLFRSGECNDYSYRKAKETYFMALLSTDVVEKERYFAMLFEKLGRVLHLIEDMGVPAHVRNDFSGHLSNTGQHVWVNDEEYEEYYTFRDKVKVYSGFANLYEHWADRKIKSDATYVQNVCQAATNMILPRFANPADYWDREQCTYYDICPDDTLPAGGLERVGLAEYVNANYLSANAMFTNIWSDKQFPFPNRLSTSEVPPKEILAEDGIADKVLYLCKFTDGENFQEDPFAAYSYTFDAVEASHEDGAADTLELCYTLDDQVHEAYAKRIIPKTVGYTAGLINHFFRGRFEVASLPILYQNKIMMVKVKIKNVSANGDALTGGYLKMVYRYTPTDWESDGSKDVIVQSIASVPLDSLAYNEEKEVLFNFYDPPFAFDLIRNYASVKCTLVYKGGLGDETDAVIGKVFKFGDIQFNEEWDKGLDGSNSWSHTATPDPDTDSGETHNTVENGLFIKENIRYAGNNLYRSNDSTVRLNPAILITPDTYVQFKTDDMTASHANQGFQSLYLCFNDELGETYYLIYTPFDHTTEQYFLGNRPKTGYFQFTLGHIIIDNIYTDLDLSGISIPDKLYLNSVYFNQFLWPSQYPTEAEHQQYMSNDFIRIIESNETDKTKGGQQ